MTRHGMSADEHNIIRFIRAIDCKDIFSFRNMCNASSSVPNLLTPCHQWPPNKIIRLCILLIIMSLTLLGNLYILFELFFRRRHHHHRTRLYYFILNLAIGDLAIFLFTMTSELFLLIYDQEWILSNVACKLTLYIQVVTIASTTFINVAMTYDRYKAICCPLKRRKSSVRIRQMIFLCWIGAFLAAIPQLFIFERSLIPGSTTTYRCASTGYTAEWQRRLYFITFSCYVLFIPVLCMTFWYVCIIRAVETSMGIWSGKPCNAIRLSLVTLRSSTNILTAKLAMMIIIVFVICWTPYIVITLIEVNSGGHFRLPSKFDGVLQAVCLIQSGLNPLIYLAFNRRRRYAPELIFAAASTISLRRRDLCQEYQMQDNSLSFSSQGTSSYRLKETIVI